MTDVFEIWFFFFFFFAQISLEKPSKYKLDQPVNRISKPICPKIDQNIKKMGKILDAILPTDFILGTKIQPNKAQLMTQVPMTLTFGQGNRSSTNVQKLTKI